MHALHMHTTCILYTSCAKFPDRVTLYTLYRRRNIYWTDVGRKRIIRAREDGSLINILVTEGIGVPGKSSMGDNKYRDNCKSASMTIADYILHLHHSILIIMSV